MTSPSAVPEPLAPEEPLEGVVVVGVVVVCVLFDDAVAVGTVAGCACKLSTAAVPKTVEPMTIGARFMRGLLEGEGFEMDAVVVDAGLAQGAGQGVGERLRA